MWNKAAIYEALAILAIFVVLVLAILGFTGVIHAGWGGGDCGPVGLPIAPIAVEQGYRWEQAASDPDCWGLRFNGVQIGACNSWTGEYRPLVAGEWGAPCKPPVALPICVLKNEKRKPPTVEPTKKKKAKPDCPCCGDICNCAAGKPCGKPECKCVMSGAVVESDGTLNFGLSRKEFAPKRTINGKEATRRQVFAALKANVPDDSKQLCLTVIGQDAERKPVLSDLESNPALSPFKGKLKIQGYAPDHWAVKDSGFILTGHPGIYCQAPNGKVLHRQDEYRGAESLAEALRNADPNYKPAADPDLNKPVVSLPSLDSVEEFLKSIPPWAWCALAFVLYLRFGHKEAVK